MPNDLHRPHRQRPQGDEGGLARRAEAPPRGERADGPPRRAGEGRVPGGLHPGRDQRSARVPRDSDRAARARQERARRPLLRRGDPLGARRGDAPGARATPTSRPRTRGSCGGRTSATRWRRRRSSPTRSATGTRGTSLLPEVGEVGQAKLLKSKVLLLGAGGLGSPAALYLAAAGVGTLGIVDADVVDASNLQRQILHATSRVGMPKVESAAKALADLNPDVKVVPHAERIVERERRANLRAVRPRRRRHRQLPHALPGERRERVPRQARRARIDLPVRRTGHDVRAGQGGEEARHSAPGPCYRCLYPEPPPPHLAPSCQEAGVLGILCGIVGTLQATEAIKLLLGQGRSARRAGS